MFLCGIFLHVSAQNFQSENFMIAQKNLPLEHLLQTGLPCVVHNVSDTLFSSLICEGFLFFFLDQTNLANLAG